MFNFLRGTKKKGKENVIPAEEIFESKVDKADNNKTEIETTLSIPDEWNVSDEERYVFAFHNSQSPRLKVNQISLYGMELHKKRDNSVLVTGLVRSTVTQSIQFEKASIFLMDKDGKKLARNEFDLSELGTLPPNSARPYNFVFTPTDFIQVIEDEIEDGWSLAFELKQKHRLDLEESWERSLDEKSKKSLEEIVEKAPPLKPNEVNFLGVRAVQQKNGDLVVTILIRNGNDKNITLEKIPLGVRDANKEEVARGSFTLDNFTVKANTSKPWSFIFPKSMVKKENMDLSKWEAFPIQ